MGTTDEQVGPPASGESKGLKAGAVGFWDGVAIGVDSTAPAYTIAAVLGSIAIIAGTKAPAVLIVSFIPMLFIAGAFYYMNRADQDCGTTFSWVTRAMGPWLGWIGGWAIFSTGVLVIGAQADVAAKYLFVLVGLDDLAENRVVVVLTACLMVIGLTWMTVRGTEMSARFQRVLVALQVGALVVFIVVAVGQMVTGSVDAGANDFSLDWFNPVGLSASALVSGMLLGVFAYWGWESAVNLNEESEDAVEAPGRAGVVSTIILLFVYLGSAVAVLGTISLGTLEEYDDDEALFGVLGDMVLGPFGWILVLAIITSGLASTQTTILPASRGSLSMAVAGAFPQRFREVHPEYGTPAFGTWVIGIAAIVWYVGGSLISQNFLFDSLSALSIVVAFYYALTGVACAIYWRRELRRSVRAFLLVGLAPVIGAVVLFVLMVAAVREYADPAESYTEASILGMGAPLAMAVLIFVLGLVLMVGARLSYAKGYFRRRGWENVSDEVARAALGPAGPGQ
ncbi:APC family permease [Janibacter alkaliphilus]|uniref:Amino acid transporter n=1 Tax=Janibacter alkaliphilus TaxID=1069963 RepID=A0A852X4I2_9MICO|nr:APC family permease [Janibacter alkaliphilus]NYG36260.1 amino acid transporter [Janibacter alkaliphilus]